VKRLSRLRRHWRNLPFVQKLAALLIALVSLPIVVVVAFTTYTTQEALFAAARARNLGRAQATAAHIDAFFDDARADVRTAGAVSAIVELCEAPGAPDRFARGLRSLEAFRAEQRLLALYVTDRSGRVLASTDDRAPAGSYQTGRAFLSAMAGESVVDDPYFDPFDRRVLLRVAHAVHAADGNIVGTVTGLIDVVVLDELTRQDTNYGGFGEFGVLWTVSGLRLSHSNDHTKRFVPWTPLPADTLMSVRQRLGPAFPGDAPIDEGFAAISERSGWLLYDRGTDPHLRVDSRTLGTVHAAAVPLAGQRWIYGIFVPEGRLIAALRTQMMRDWAVAFFTVLAALVLSLIATKSVTRPLRVVADTANALAGGDMTRRAQLDQEDEFGQLGDAFDGMASALAEKERQLESHAADLERRIEERTATLQLLERASRTLASSLDLRRMAANLAGLLVPTAADFCSIDIRELNGTLRRAASRHAEPALDRVANEFADVRALRDPAMTLSARQRAALGLSDVRVYQLNAGRQFVGFLTVAMAASGRVFDADAERVFEEIGHRAGLGIANALLFQEAQDANRLKDEFLGVVSHELRTPLNAIMGWTRLAGMSREAGIDPRKALEAVDRNARALARLVDDLLDVPRIVMGKLALDIRPVDLVAVVGAAVDGMRPAAAAKSLTLELQSELAAGTLEGDPHRLQQVFWNLLSNAVKFTPTGGRITVHLRPVNDSLVVSVEDTGIGIAGDFLPFVFDRFRQADSSTTRVHGGLGIGLAIVRHLVEMHGGQVSASSAGPGAGSTFTVQLPAAFGEPMPHDAEDPPPSRASVERLRGMHLLLLDDDHDSRDVAAQLLAASGTAVTSAGSVAEAVDVLGRSPGEFDAVLADIGMPGEDGYAFIAGLRASHDARLRALPVIAVTAYASSGDRARALAAGFDAHVAKPVSIGVLAEALVEALTLRAAR
jgi:signal transduction histidine kinase/ActR/RegA family two-component response regulator/HAMP domain-containing protein